MNSSSLFDFRGCVGATSLAFMLSAGAGACLIGAEFFAPSEVILALSVISLASACAGLWFLRCVRRDIERGTEICHLLVEGDFSRRITDIRDTGALGALLWSINDMTDRVDAFVREASAAMDYVGRNQYFRRILENGMHGSLLHGARVINRATQSVEQKMNGFVEVATDFDTSLKGVVSDLNSSITALTESASNMNEVVSASNASVESAISRSDEASSGTQSISSAAEQMSASITEISQQVTHTAEIANRAVTEAKQSRAAVEELVAASEKIGEIVSVISAIAGQTNLLALNATIEAARAAEAGKGFAVVAAEVKELSTQTASATQEIEAYITSIQSVTERVASAFSNIGGVVEEVNTSTSTVAAAVEEQSAASREIASGSERAAAGVDGMAQDVHQLGGSISQASEAAGLVSGVTDRLSTEVTSRITSLLTKMDGFMSELRKVA